MACGWQENGNPKFEKWPVILGDIMKNERDVLEFQGRAWEFWGRMCLRCRRPAATLHEILPRSIHRLWYTEVTNSVPLCDNCHRWAHGAGEAGRVELQAKVKDWLEHEWRPE